MNCLNQSTKQTTPLTSLELSCCLLGQVSTIVCMYLRGGVQVAGELGRERHASVCGREVEGAITACRNVKAAPGPGRRIRWWNLFCWERLLSSGHESRGEERRAGLALCQVLPCPAHRRTPLLHCCFCCPPLCACNACLCSCTTVMSLFILLHA